LFKGANSATRLLANVLGFDFWVSISFCLGAGGFSVADSGGIAGNTKSYAGGEGKSE